MEWIKLSDQKPKNKQRCIIAYNGFSKYGFVDIATYSADLHEVDEYDFPNKDDGFYDFDSECGHFKFKDVIAWMPAPEFPTNIAEELKNASLH